MTRTRRKPTPAQLAPVIAVNQTKARVYELHRGMETTSNALAAALELIDLYGGDAPNGLVKPLREALTYSRKTLGEN